MDESVHGALAVGNVLEHHGIKGMKWGVRRKNPGTPTEVVVSHKPGSKVKAEGGENQPAHPDAKKAAASKQTAKKSSTDSLSTKDLQELVNRMNLEQQYSKLSSEKGTLDKGHEKAKKILSVADTGSRVYNFVNSPAGKALKASLKVAAVVA